MTDAFIFDIDGTIADCSHRLHFIIKPKDVVLRPYEVWSGDYDSFYSACSEDTPIDNVIRVLKAIKDSGVQVLYVTGRPEKCREKTLAWLNKYVGQTDGDCLYMRTDGDHREDFDVKREIYESKIRDNYRVAGVFEDRLSVILVWQRLGLTVFRVGDGTLY